ncbi:MAG: ribosome assembly RNA-binding protein YhbY [Mariprofundaceae bacterium]
MSLDNKQKKQLKARAHHLKPVVRIGQHGLTPNVIKETDSSLERHELIKVHIHEGKREDRHTMAIELAKASRAEFVHRIGKVFILYRERQNKT